MASTIKQVLLNTLEDLSQRDMKKFCARLLDREGEPRVRRSAIEGQDDIVVVEVLVSTFTEDKAGRVTLEILRAIGCNNLAVELETSLETLISRRRRASGRNSSQAATAQHEQHFVDQHRDTLIQRIRSMPAIMDQLLAQNVASQEQYDTILGIQLPQNQVRRLYSGPLTSSGTVGKDIFLCVLENIEPFLVNDLRRK